MAATLNLLLASHSVLKQGLDLVAIGGRALRIVTGRGMNQQCHGALQLLLPVSPLGVCQASLELIDAPHLSLNIKNVLRQVLLPYTNVSQTRILNSARKQRDRHVAAVPSLTQQLACHVKWEHMYCKSMQRCQSEQEVEVLTLHDLLDRQEQTW